jgi:hypothetical protein
LAAWFDFEAHDEKIKIIPERAMTEYKIDFLIWFKFFDFEICVKIV